jgi:hypothetical protein
VAGAFDQFWSAYPRKVGRLAAQREWAKLNPPIAEVLAALAWQVPTWDDPQFVCHPRTWLHQGRWLDEPPAQTPRFTWDCPHVEHCAHYAMCEVKMHNPQKYPLRHLKAV